MPPIPIAKLNFGSIDAKNEILLDQRRSTTLFLDSFVTPSPTQLDRLRNGEYHFITGLKGTGKTALLRYLDILEKGAGSQTLFVLFKSDISAPDREQLSRVSGYTVVEEPSSKYNLQQDFEDCWRWLFHQIIVDSIEASQHPIVMRDEAYRTYQSCVKSTEPQSSSLRRLIPRLHNGRIELGGQISGFIAKFSADIDLDRSKTTASFGSLVRLSTEALGRLRASPGRLRLFVDEIELSYGTRENYDRDCRLIRDLVVVITRFNETFLRQRLPILIVGAIRSEVVNSVAALGKEINKYAADFGFSISWSQRSQEYDHPLLRVVEKKIHASEKAELGYSNDGDVWNVYFPARIYNSDMRSFLLHNTWYRPRDLVRLLTLTRDAAGDAEKIRQIDIELALKQYATASWLEHTEELQASYSSSQIDAIKTLFSGFRREFSFDSLRDVAERRAKLYPHLRKLLRDVGLPTILQDLFRIGIVGNSYSEIRRDKREKIHRWAFRGEDMLLLDKRIGVHRALWRAFSLVN